MVPMQVAKKTHPIESPARSCVPGTGADIEQDGRRTRDIQCDTAGVSAMALHIGAVARRRTTHTVKGQSHRSPIDGQTLPVGPTPLPTEPRSRHHSAHLNTSPCWRMRPSAISEAMILAATTLDRSITAAASPIATSAATTARSS